MYFQAITEVDSLVGVDSTFAQNIIINESFINPDLPYVEGDIFPVLWAYSRDYPEFPAIYEVNNRPFKAVIDLLNFCSNFELLKQLLIYFGLTVIPVELTSFTASDSENESKLEWTTATEINNQGFEVQRKTSVGDFAAIGFIEGKGTTTEQQNYSFIDKSLSEGKYSYRLKQIDFDGSFEYSKTIEVEIHNPLKFSLSQNYPNPFNPSTKISWQSPVAGWQTLKVYDVLGNLVTTLVDEYKPAGSYEVEFKSTVGSLQLANGIYFYQLKAGNFVETKKMILLK
ncbi:MAG: T9SS type A sorting domain-containing protein [Ignavibacteriales bacterium]|nr:T9SS type A sorting domain-containing protein [Ignavibacteriales bacterium]